MIAIRCGKTIITIFYWFLTISFSVITCRLEKQLPFLLSFTVKKDYKIEEQNNISVNLFGYENRQPYPIYVSKEKFENELNLLSITDCENKHYVLIKDFNMPIYHKTKHQHRKNFCMYCLQCCSSEEILNRHKTDCYVITSW